MPEILEPCPADSFDPGVFHADFTADGDVLLDWDDGPGPSPTLLVTHDGMIAYSGMFLEMNRQDRSHRGIEPLNHALSPELQQPFQRLVSERSA